MTTEREALQAADRLCKEALPKFNWGASALDANAIHLLNTVPGQIAEAIAAVAPLTASSLPWAPLDTAPRNTFVLLRGPSGHAGTDHVFQVARHDDRFRPLQPWVTPGGDSVTDCGWDLERDRIEWVTL